MKVSWDDAKDLANQRNHGVSFEEASELFRSGVDYLEIFDDAHSVLVGQRSESRVSTALT